MLRKYATATVLDAYVAGEQSNSLVRVAHRAEFDYVPRPGYLYVRSRMISSRVNDNHDEFPAEEIEAAWKTAIGKPAFVNHHNEDHRRMRGVIIDAALHKDVAPDGRPDVWIEALHEIDAKRFPKLAQAILAGRVNRTSMGTDVGYSICSACGNKATNPSEYCQHIPQMKGKILYRHTASGKREGHLIREICYKLGFFENSFLVEDPADPTAVVTGVDDRGLKAVASKTAKDERFEGVGLIQDDDGKWFVRTHRARSESYDKPEDIPDSEIEWIRSTGVRKEAVPQGIRFRFTPAEQHERGNHYLEARVPAKGVPDGDYAGYLEWSPGHGMVEGIKTRDDLGRQGIASALWHRAHEVAAQHDLTPPRHSDVQTPEGIRWAEHVDAQPQDKTVRGQQRLFEPAPEEGGTEVTEPPRPKYHDLGEHVRREHGIGIDDPSEKYHDLLHRQRIRDRFHIHETKTAAHKDGFEVGEELGWEHIGERHPQLYGDPEEHGPAAEGADGWGIGEAVNHLAHARPADPEAENFDDLWGLNFHSEMVDPKHIDYARSDPGDPRVAQARQGYASHPTKVPPLVLVHRHGVYQVADGHHRAEAAHKEGRKVRAYVAYSPHADEPYGDGERAPFHGAEPHPGRQAKTSSLQRLASYWVDCERDGCEGNHWGPHGAAGLLIRHKDESGQTRYLLQKRAPWVDQGGTWGIPGGAIHEDETPRRGAHREAEEEMGDLPPLQHHRTHTDDHGGWAYHTVIADAPEQFHPTVRDSEATDHKWVTRAEMKNMDLHPGFAKSLRQVMGMRKGAPFAGYDDFEDCTEQNQDKRDPDAYCGEIKHKVEDGKKESSLPRVARNVQNVRGGVVHYSGEDSRVPACNPWQSAMKFKHTDAEVTCKQCQRRGYEGQDKVQKQSSLPRVVDLDDVGDDEFAGLSAVEAAAYKNPEDHPFFQETELHPKHIIAAYDEADEGTRAQGMRWYADAHHIAKALDPDGDAHRGGGVLAAYSPRTVWPVNLFNASRSLQQRRAVRIGEGMNVMGNHARAAERIIEGGGHYLNVFKTPKITDFAHLIAHGGDDDGCETCAPHKTSEHPQKAVVVDRHALSVAAGRRMNDNDLGRAPMGKRKFYEHAAEQFRRAAEAVSVRDGVTVHPHQMQAITWLQQQKRNTAEDAQQDFGGRGRITRDKNAWERWQEHSREHHPDLVSDVENMHLRNPHASRQSSLPRMAGWEDKYADRPTPRQHKPEGRSPEDEWHGSYEVVQHPETGGYHVVDNAGRDATPIPLAVNKGFKTQPEAERSRDYIDERRQGKERAKEIGDKLMAPFFEPYGGEEGYRLHRDNENMMHLQRRYEGNTGKFGFAGEDQDGEAYYEVKHALPNGNHSGWKVRHYADGPNAEILHEATDEDAHELFHIGAPGYQGGPFGHHHPPENFGHEHLKRVLDNFHRDVDDDGEELGGTREYKEGQYGDPRIRQWKQDWPFGKPISKTSKKIGYNETKAPADVDTLRTETCPVCGEHDSFDGNRCRVCHFLQPPAMFTDPDTGVAKQQDMQKDLLDQTQVGPNGQPIEGVPGQPGDPSMEQGMPGEAGDQIADLFCPACGFSADTQAPMTNNDPSMPAEQQGLVEGDVCPNCGQATMLSPNDVGAMGGEVPQEVADDANANAVPDDEEQQVDENGGPIDEDEDEDGVPDDVEEGEADEEEDEEAGPDAVEDDEEAPKGRKDNRAAR